MKIIFKSGKELDLESPEEFKFMDGLIKITHDLYNLTFNTQDILYIENSEGYKLNF